MLLCVRTATFDVGVPLNATNYLGQALSEGNWHGEGKPPARIRQAIVTI